MKLINNKSSNGNKGAIFFQFIKEMALVVGYNSSLVITTHGGIYIYIYIYIYDIFYKEFIHFSPSLSLLSSKEKESF